MAKENKNQDPEEEKNKNANDDDFGLPDFEFEALDDDDDDESADTEEVSSDNVEDLDIEDLDELDLDEVDLENIDLDNLDKELEDLDATIEETSVPDASDENTDQPVGELEDDGLFYEEESFEDFDDDFGKEEEPKGDVQEELTPSLQESDGSEFLEEEVDGPANETTEGSIFDSDDEAELDLGEEDYSGLEMDSEGTEEETVPFAQRELQEEYTGTTIDEADVPEISNAEITSSKSKFARIVVLGTLTFLLIGAGFLYWSGFFDKEGGASEVAAKSETVKEGAQEKKATASESEGKAAKKGAEGEKAEPAKKAPAKSSTKKPVAKQKTQPKKAASRPATSSGGATVLQSRSNQRHLIAGSFVDERGAQTYAKKLAADGASPSIIPPFGRSQNYRVSVASFATKVEALQNLDSYRERYGSGVWMLRY